MSEANDPRYNQHAKKGTPVWGGPVDDKIDARIANLAKRHKRRERAPETKYSLEDVVRGLVGDGNETDTIINNFLSSNGSPINIRKHFFNVLESWEAAPPLNSLWVVYFKVPRIVTDDTMEAWGEHIISMGSDKDGNSGSVDLARNKLDTHPFQHTVGCAFAQTVQIPQEQINMERVGIQNSRGFIPTPVITTRQQFASVNVEFLETNISFVDFLMRPWAILGSHFGSVARGNDEQGRRVNLSTDMLVINLSRAGFAPSISYDDRGDHRVENERGFIPRKIWLFSGCQPVTIDSQRSTYSTDATLERRNVEFMFKRYQVFLPSRMEELFTKVDKDEGGRGIHRAAGPAPAAKFLHAGISKNIAARDKTTAKIIEAGVYNYWGMVDGS